MYNNKENTICPFCYSMGKKRKMLLQESEGCLLREYLLIFVGSCYPPEREVQPMLQANDFLVWRDSGVSLKGRISCLPKQPYWLYSQIAVQQHSPLLRKLYPSEHWLRSRCLTSLILNLSLDNLLAKMHQKRKIFSQK